MQHQYNINTTHHTKSIQNKFKTISMQTQRKRIQHRYNTNKYTINEKQCKPNTNTKQIQNKYNTNTKSIQNQYKRNTNPIHKQHNPYKQPIQHTYNINATEMQTKLKTSIQHMYKTNTTYKTNTKYKINTTSTTSI